MRERLQTSDVLERLLSRKEVDEQQIAGLVARAERAQPPGLVMEGKLCAVAQSERQILNCGKIGCCGWCGWCLMGGHGYLPGGCMGCLRSAGLLLLLAPVLPLCRVPHWFDVE